MTFEQLNYFVSPNVQEKKQLRYVLIKKSIYMIMKSEDRL